jgi:hypothetical protein
LNFVERAIADKNAFCGNYWASSSGDALLKEMLVSSNTNTELKYAFERLLSRQTVDVLVDKTIVYDTMMESNAAIMGTLLFSGYLTAEKELADGRYLLRIPNYEVLSCFRTLVDACNEEERGKNVNAFIRLLVQQDAIGASEILTEKIQSILCYTDKADKQDQKRNETLITIFLRDISHLKKAKAGRPKAKMSKGMAEQISR